MHANCQFIYIFNRYHIIVYFVICQALLENKGYPVIVGIGNASIFIFRT